jgi:hypothetical protein
VPPIPGLYSPYTHADCVCNEVVAATNRVLGEVPRPTPAGLVALRHAARRVKWKLPTVSEWSYEEVIETMSGRRKNRYTLAAESLLESGL